MELRDYLSILWRRKWVIICTFLVTVAVVIVSTVKTTPIFTASTMLRIATYTSGAVNSLDYTYANRLTNTYVKLATTKPVLDELMKRLGLTNLPNIGVTIVGETELLQIKVEHQDPILAANIANTLADILVSQSVELYTGSSAQSQLEILKEQLNGMEDELTQARKKYLDLVEQNPDNAMIIEAAKQSFELKQDIYSRLLDKYEQARISTALREKSIYVVDPAIPPDAPSKPNVMRNIVLGSLVGLLGAVGLSFLFENLDTTLYTKGQIENLIKLPNFGMVPNAKVQKQFISYNGSNPYSDAFRHVRTSINRLDSDIPIKTLLITSAEPGEGKSTIVANLALALASDEKKVIVVDCDLRIPNQHKKFNLPNEIGLTSVLLQKTNLEESIQGSEKPGLKILTSGSIPRNPSELLGSSQMGIVLNQLRKRFDFILLDTPAILQVTDTAVLAPYMDGVILVVSQAISHRDNVLAALKELEENKARMIGLIINRAEQLSRYYYHKPKAFTLK